MRVVEIMRRTVVTVRPEAPLREVARLLIDHGISGLPVVDASGAVVGVVSEADFVLKERGAPERRHRLLDWLFGEPDAERADLAKVEAATAGEAMTSPAVTIQPETSVRDAARIMTERQINRLPVVEAGLLVGIVSRADIVRAFVRSDDELRSAIVEEVVRHAMWLDERDIEVAVTNGYARLHGTVERRSDVPILARLVREVPGVIDAEVAVGWRLDDTGITAEPADLVNPPFGPG